MDISGMIQSAPYDPRAASTAAYSRAIMAPQYATSISYSTATSAGIIAQYPAPQHNPFSSTTYGSSNVPSFGANYIQPRSQIQMLAQRPQTQPLRQAGYMNKHHSPTIKPEIGVTSSINTNWSVNSNPAAPEYSTSTIPSTGSGEIMFGTDVDTLMKAIQTKAQTAPAPQSSPIEQSKSVVGYSLSTSYHSAPQSFVDTTDRTQRLTSMDPRDEKSLSKKRYQCGITGCSKSFYQKTHLEIHIRAHTGQKPYACKAQGCNQHFSQLGNLKTHERRHTGERPYSCEICGKTFAQRGNVRAHKIVHEQTKPYSCKLEDCGKQFTQLGNLKSHMNKFHAAALRNLTSRFASICDGDAVSATDKDTWEYFAKLYRNSNKGIKGRGKDRKVGLSSHAPGSSMGFVSRGMTHFGDSMHLSGGMANREGSHPSSGYEMEYEESGSGSQGSASSTASMYGVDAVPVEAYDAEGRSLAFGDRMY